MTVTAIATYGFSVPSGRRPCEFREVRGRSQEAFVRQCTPERSCFDGVERSCRHVSPVSIRRIAELLRNGGRKPFGGEEGCPLQRRLANTTNRGQVTSDGNR